MHVIASFHPHCQYLTERSLRLNKEIDPYARYLRTLTSFFLSLMGLRVHIILLFQASSVDRLQFFKHER